MFFFFHGLLWSSIVEIQGDEYSATHCMSLWCRCNVTVMSQCYHTELSLWCHSNVIVMYMWYHCIVNIIFQWYFCDVSVMSFLCYCSGVIVSSLWNLYDINVIYLWYHCEFFLLQTVAADVSWWHCHYVDHLNLVSTLLSSLEISSKCTT